MKRLAYILSIILLCVACEKEYPLHLENEEQRLFLECLSGASDETLIRLKAATPVTHKDSIPVDISKAEVTFAINGEKQSLTRVETRPEQRLVLYRMNTPLREGDKIEVKASAAGLDPVSAHSYIPHSIKGMSLAIKGMIDEDYLAFDLDIPDGTVGEHYGIQIIRYCESQREYDKNALSFGGVGHPSGEIIRDTTIRYNIEMPVINMAEEALGIEMNEPMIVGYDGVSLLGNRWNTDLDDLVLLDDSMLSDGGRKFTFMLRYYDDREVSYYFDEEKTQLMMSERRTYRYKVRLYRLSPEFYRFAKARYELDNNFLGQLGLSPATFTYTNVSGGFGVVAGVTAAETAWLDNI